jgi:hypothetical protein
VQVAFGSMSDQELRGRMHDIWVALYVRLRASCPERASQVIARFSEPFPSISTAITP